MQTSGALLYPEPQEILSLIEMGKKLYPEYQDTNGGNTWGFLDSHRYCATICIYKDDGTIYVNWYEFLIRWIIPKIDIPFNSQWRAFVIDSKDPIGPVYEEFKRRKL